MLFNDFNIKLACLVPFASNLWVKKGSILAVGFRLNTWDIDKHFILFLLSEN